MSADSSACVLCQVVFGELHVDLVVDTERIAGFVVHREAYSRGHCVFFPKRHTPSLHEVDDLDLAELLPAIKTVATALDVTSYNVLQNNGALAGQTVFHAHLHLIPKTQVTDGLCRDNQPSPGIDQTGIAERLRARLAR